MPFQDCQTLSKSVNALSSFRQATRGATLLITGQGKRLGGLFAVEMASERQKVSALSAFQQATRGATL